MKMKFTLLLFSIFALYFGYQSGRAPFVEKLCFPVVEQKKFAVVIYGSNDAYWVEKKALLSTFQQEYENFRILFIDDNSEDGTFMKVENFLLENRKEEKAILIRNEEKIGKVGSFYRIKECLLDEEIVIFLDAKDALMNERSLSDLNAIYQNPDVWMTVSAFVEYPSYERKEGISNTCLATSFYAGLFKKIPLVDLMEEGRFSQKEEIFLQKIADFCGPHLHRAKDPLLLHTQITPLKEKKEIAQTKVKPLKTFREEAAAARKTKLLLFSYDRPMQLFACLESVEKYVTGLDCTSVIYRASSPRFFSAYEEVKKAFPHVQFVVQEEKKAKKVFKPLVMREVFQKEIDYILFGVDDLIVKDFVDLSFCVNLLEKTKAYGFYLRFGKNIDFSYQTKESLKRPESLSLGKKVFAWDILRAEHDWSFANNVDMTLFAKETLRKSFAKMRFKNPNTLEFAWTNEHRPEKAIGLYFEESKVFNLPLNVVAHAGNPHMNFASPEELLVKFEQNYRIDIDPFYRLPNNSPHFECTPVLKIKDSF